MQPEKKPTTAIITLSDCGHFFQMPFGLNYAWQTFQHFKDWVGADMALALIYLDNILVASPDIETHRVHLTIVQLLQEFSSVRT